MLSKWEVIEGAELVKAFDDAWLRFAQDEQDEQDECNENEENRDEYRMSA